MTALTSLKAGRFSLSLERPLVMGIVNVTPDSFSDGGLYETVALAVDRGLAMRDQGASVIDVGGESTRPGADPVSTEVELARVIPVIRALREAAPDLALSVDTSKAEVAWAAWKAGVDVINDVTGLTGDPGMVEVVAETGAGVVIMHMKGTPSTMQEAPHYQDVFGDVRRFFQEQLERTRLAGVDDEQVVFDPGIGFGKNLEHNLALLRRLGELAVEGRPLMLGVSRKSLFKRLLGAGAAERETMTLVCSALAYAAGVRLHRVHDVRANLMALRLAEALQPLGNSIAPEQIDERP
jgi:dihydropteroate synthase